MLLNEYCITKTWIDIFLIAFNGEIDITITLDYFLVCDVESSHRFADWKWGYISLLIIEKWQIRGSCVLTQDFFGQMF